MKTKYPHLTKILSEMFSDNYGSMLTDFVKPRSKWIWPNDVSQLEVMASKLSADEKLVYAAGEDSEQKAITKKHKCKPLNNFLCAVFDGDLNGNFCHDGTDN